MWVGAEAIRVNSFMDIIFLLFIDLLHPFEKPAMMNRSNVLEAKDSS